MMKTLLFTAFVAALSPISLSANAYATEVSIANGAAPDFHLNTALNNFKQAVEANKKCNINIKLYPAAQMGDDREAVENAMSGIVDIAIPSMSVLGGWNRAFLLPELPYMFPNKDTAYKVFSTKNAYTDLLAQRAQNIGLELLGFMESGYREVGNNVRPINKMEDFNGIKLRVMQVDAHVKLFRELGASPVPMASGEAYTAIQQGVVDGLDNALGHMVGLKFMEVVKYVSLTDHVYTPYAIVANPGLKDKLSSECYSFMVDEFKKTQDYQQQLIQDLDKEYIKTMEGIGVKVNTVDQKEKDRMRAATQTIRDEYDEDDGAYKVLTKVIDEI